MGAGTTSLSLLILLTTAGVASAVGRIVSNPCPTMLAGIDGDTVIVADGTYAGVGNRDLDFGGKEITVCSENGLYGRIIDREGNRGFYVYDGERATVIVEGPSIRGLGAPHSYGAGMRRADSGPMIGDCPFVGGNVDGGEGATSPEARGRALTFVKAGN